MNLTYHSFAELHTKEDATIFGDLLKETSPWMLNNMTWLIVCLAVTSMVLFYIQEKYKKAAKDDNELMAKYVLFLNKGKKCKI